MARLSLSSLRIRLLLLVLLAVLPVFGNANAAISTGTAAAGGRCGAGRCVAAGSPRRCLSSAVNRGAHQLLVTLAQLPTVRGTNPAACSAFFASLLKQYQIYTNFAVMTPEGEVVCSALPTQSVVNVADQAFFRRARERRDFAIGGYLIGSITGRPVAMAVYPVLDDARQLDIVIAASLDLAWLNQFATQAQLPLDSIFSVRDRQGAFLARYPNPGAMDRAVRARNPYHPGPFSSGSTR